MSTLLNHFNVKAPWLGYKNSPKQPLLNHALFTFCLLLGGCNAVPPSPQSTLNLPAHYAGNAKATSKANIDAWWLSFGDPQLNLLIKKARKANFDVNIALSRVEQAQAGARSLGSNLMPMVNITGSRANNASGLPAMVKQGNPDVKSARIAAEANWEIDIFGINRAAKTAAEQDAAAAAWGVEGARLIAISETCKQYVLYQSIIVRKNILHDILITQQQTLHTTQLKSKEGLASDFDLSRIKADVYQTQSLIPPLDTALEVTKNQIALLTNTLPQQLVIQPNAAILASPIIFDAIPTNQPVELLTRRPDIKAAENQLAAASARLGQAHANRLPRFFLSALFGREGLTINGLNLTPVVYKNIALAFALPILDFGRITAAETAQSAKENEALLNYDKTIFTALTQVENALSARHDELEKNGLLAQIKILRNQSRKHADTLYTEGQIDLLQLLDVQRGVLSAEMNLIDSTTQQAMNTINLYTTLGGGWQNASPENVKNNDSPALPSPPSSSPQ